MAIEPDRSESIAESGKRMRALKPGDLKNTAIDPRIIIEQVSQRPSA
jgi:hypothetical protein